MEYIYAAMLLHKAGQKIEESSVKKVLEAAGVKPDDARIKALVAALENVDIEKAIKESAVVAAGPAPAAGGASGQPSGDDKKDQGKKEEKKEEEGKSAEEAAAGLGALFG